MLFIDGLYKENKKTKNKKPKKKVKIKKNEVVAVWWIVGHNPE